jgi:acyl-CoA thioesterase
VTAYFERLGPTSFRATDHTRGAWDPTQMHVAPTIGLLAHAIESDRDARRDDGLLLTRLSVDILGTMPVGTLEVAVRVLRPGRTIELVEATLAHDGRTALIARAWLQQGYDTGAVQWSALPSIPGPHELEAFDPAAGWAGTFARTIEARRRLVEPGRGQVWLRLGMPLLDDEPVSTTAQVLGVADIVNGMTPRLTPEVANYPNLDLTVHLFRLPRDAWIGFDTEVSIGADGIGLTRAALHDADGPIGASAQTLTVRLRDE